MRTLCWWCKAENNNSATKCNNCGAPLNQNLQSSSTPGLFSKWATLIIEVVVLFVCMALVFSWIEEVERSEASKTQRNPATAVGTPSPSPSPTPKPRSTNRRRAMKKKDEFPVMPTEQAPSPDIPIEDNSSTPNQNGQRFN